MAVRASVAAVRWRPARDVPGDVVHRVCAYVADYGEKASVVVATEHYSQIFTSSRANGATRRALVADFVIVKAEGVGWIGFRDVVKWTGKRVTDH